jgi:alpha-tubulin suppressor-like RCC1 family protein
LQVDGGDRHTCGVIDGGLYCWGENQSGALGLGTFENAPTPMRVGMQADWTSAGAGNGFSCGIRAGLVFCWGTGSSGQLGAGQFLDSTSPLEVSLPGNANQLAVGSQHACAILDDERLFCWGHNAEGQLAQDDPWSAPGVNSATPLEVASGTTWSKVAAGDGHTCGLQTDGTLWCWGRNSRGELGQGTAQADQTRVPEQSGVEANWEDIATGQNHSCGIRGGHLYCWGANGHGQLGSAVAEFAEEPTLVSGINGALQVTVDTFHTCVIAAGRELSCWGRNIEGILGDGTIEARSVPTPAVPLSGWDQVAAGRFHTCGTREGAILCTGENGDGRLGVGDLERRQEFTPTLISE